METSGEKTISVPVYGTFVVYPNGTRDESACQQFTTPDTVVIRPGDQFGFAIGAVADVVDDDLKNLAEALASVPLRDLKIGGCTQVTDRGLGYLAQFSELEELVANSIRGVSRRGWAVLERFPRLVKLNLEWAANIDDSTTETIARLSRLRELNLDQCPGITDAGVERLGTLSGLTSLGLNEARLTDRGLAAIARLTRLRGLSLSACARITDRGLALLSELPELDYLSLPNCSGFLRRLLTGVGISRKGLERFSQARPNCTIWSEEIYQEQQRMLSRL